MIKLSKVISVITVVAFFVVVFAVIAGGLFLVWVDGCSEGNMIPFTCQFLP